MQVYGLIGSPIDHSLSPRMHEAAYRARDLDARYVTLEPDSGALAAAIDGADALGLAGLNVTVPFKEDVAALVDTDSLATRIGAVNTIDFGGTEPTGHNTDAAGVIRAFAHHDVALTGAAAVVVGAGGAGRAVAFALAEAGAAVHVANRTAERATDLVAAIEATPPDDAPDIEATASGLDALADHVPHADVLVNATTVGMEEDRSPVPAGLLHADCAVLDAVYTPLDTRLLRDARAAGATTIDGGWMLLYQGVEAFERWTGQDAPVDAMNDALRAELDTTADV